MEVIKLQEGKILPGSGGLSMVQLFGNHAGIKMGVATFKPGTRAPAEGAAAHDGDEYSYIISGHIDCCSGGLTYRIGAGDSAHIPAGEEHYSYNDGVRDCVLIYMLLQNNGLTNS